MQIELGFRAPIMWNEVARGFDERSLHAHIHKYSSHTYRCQTEPHVYTGWVVHNADRSFLFVHSPFNSIIRREFRCGKWTFDSLIRTTHSSAYTYTCAHICLRTFTGMWLYVSWYKMCFNSLVYMYICVYALESLTAFGLRLIPSFGRSNSFVLNIVATTVVAVGFAGILFNYLILVIALQQPFGGSLKPLLSSICGNLYAFSGTSCLWIRSQLSWVYSVIKCFKKRYANKNFIWEVLENAFLMFHKSNLRFYSNNSRVDLLTLTLTLDLIWINLNNMEMD